MSVLNIYTVNELTWNCRDISLRQPCRKVLPSEINEEWFISIVRSMFETLYSTPSGVGLAAPQVGIQLQLIVIDIKRDGKKPLVLINPIYEPTTDELVDSVESCLSVPQKKGVVKRYNKVMVNYTNANGEETKEELDGFRARVFQHEIDHLSGCLYIDRIDDSEKISFNEGVPYQLAQKAIDNIK